jgi:hypothetical protein
MATFFNWLTDQKDRQDATGYFARYWIELKPKPRLSSPSSILSHLEDREEGGFRDQAIEWKEGTCTGLQIREAFDLTLAEYRKVRAQTVEAAAAADGVVQQPQLPYTDEGGQSPGEIVERATAAAVTAGQAHLMPLIDITAGDAGSSQALLIAIARDLELIKLALGIARDEDGAVVRFPPAAGMPSEPMHWAAWWDQADLTATDAEA